MDQTLKQRLVGAVVLVSLAVIFIPIILEGPADEWTPRSHDIPVPPAIEYRSGIHDPASSSFGDRQPDPLIRDTETALPDAPLSQPAEEVVAEIKAPDAPAVVEAKPEPEPLPVTPAPEVVKEKPLEPVSPPASGWFVQVGSFGQKSNADGLQQRLKKAGFSVTVESGGSGSKPVYRVLVGPEGSRASAGKLAQKLEQQHRLKGLVVDRNK